MNTDTQTAAIIEVATGEVKTAHAPARLQCLALGSCVAVILYDANRQIGGIAHIMLPSSLQGAAKPQDADVLKYADNAIRELVKRMRELGAGESAMIARLVGGALVIPDTSNIGQENIDAVRKVLGELGIRIIDEHLGGIAGRSVLFDVATGGLEINGTAIPLEAAAASAVLSLRTGKQEHGDKSSDYIRELEQKVADRTKELDQRIQELENVRKATFNLLEDLEKEREELTRAKAKDEEMLASIADGLVVVDRDMRTILINRAAEAATGWNSDEVMNKVWPDVIGLATEDGKPVSAQDQPLFRAIHGGATTANTYQYTRKDKTKFPAAVTVSPVKVADELIGAVLVFRDVTRERQIDKAKTEFVSLASHQLRTPLTSIKWYTEILLAGDAGALSDPQKKYLNEVYSGNQRIIKLVNMLLNVSRIELGTFVVEPEPTDITVLARSVVEEQQPQVEERKLKFTFSVGEGIPLMPADPQLLRMVMQNLLSNAVKYTPEGGTVGFSLAVGAAKSIILKVSDTGYGIPQHQQGQIFTKLFRADNVREQDTDGTGTGLGLYIVKSILDISGGEIRFESEENKGTTFYVALPVAGMKKKGGAKALA